MEKQILVMVQKQIGMENILVPYGYLLLFLNEALPLMESDAQAVDTWQRILRLSSSLLYATVSSFFAAMRGKAKLLGNKYNIILSSDRKSKSWNELNNFKHCFAEPYCYIQLDGCAISHGFCVPVP